MNTSSLSPLLVKHLERELGSCHDGVIAGLQHVCVLANSLYKAFSHRTLHCCSFGILTVLFQSKGIFNSCDLETIKYDTISFPSVQKQGHDLKVVSLCFEYNLAFTSQWTQWEETAVIWRLQLASIFNKQTTMKDGSMCLGVTEITAIPKIYTWNWFLFSFPCSRS